MKKWITPVARNAGIDRQIRKKAVAPTIRSAVSAAPAEMLWKIRSPRETTFGT